MIINLRGTGGSGKSTVVTRIMALYEKKEPKFIEKRRQPFYYELHAPHSGLAVLGHYEIACGGCDTIQSPDAVYQLLNEKVAEGFHVLYEGIIIGDDVTRAVEVSRHHPFRVIALNTSMNECLAGIQKRRDERGDDRPLDPKNTLSRNDRLKRIMARLKDANVDARWMNREEAYQQCREEFGV